MDLVCHHPLVDEAVPLDAKDPAAVEAVGAELADRGFQRAVPLLDGTCKLGLPLVVPVGSVEGQQRERGHENQREDGGAGHVDERGDLAG